MKPEIMRKHASALLTLVAFTVTACRPAPSPYLHTSGLVSARCVNDGPRGYLSVRTNADPADPRTDRVGGEVGALGFFLPGWGMHLNDLPEAQGDLISRISEISPRPAR